MRVLRPHTGKRSLAAGVAAIAAAAIVLAGGAPAGSAESRPAEPVLTSVGADPFARLKATWRPAAGLDDVSRVSLLWNTTGVVEGGGGSEGASGSESPPVSATSHTTRAVLDPGEYYVQVCYTDSSRGDFCSAVRSLTVPAPPSGQAVEAEVVRGVAEVERDGARLRLSAATKLRPGDRIHTRGSSALALLVFGDGSRMQIGPNSSFELTGEGAEGLTLEKVLGKLRFLLKRRYQVRTPTACACVRGTTFTVTSTPTSTLVQTYEGSVKLSNTRGRRKRSVIVKAGFESRVRGTRPPARARRFKPPKRPFWR